MRVKVIIAQTGNLFGETFVIDVGDPGDRVTMEGVARHFLMNGVIVGGRWISPLRIMEFTEVKVEAPEAPKVIQLAE